MPPALYAPSKSRRDWLEEIMLLVVFNSLIAAYLSAIYSDAFAVSLLFSQTIGLTIYATVNLLSCSKLCYEPIILYGLAIPIGSSVGISLSYFICGILLQSNLAEYFIADTRPGGILYSVLNALFFGSAVSYFYYSKYVLLDSNRELTEQQRKRAELERAASVSQLRVLQAQIEPHFLHNILANVISLIDSDPKQAQRMLQHLAELLRVSLKRTRAEQVSLREELEVVESYLQIQQIRLGDRMQYRMEIEPQALEATLPPLSIQPLVENSLRHGIEPSRTGGLVLVTAKVKDQKLHISVSNNGVGIDHKSIGGSGVSLNNLRSRLTTLYGDAASLTLIPQQSEGMQTLVELPAQKL